MVAFRKLFPALAILALLLGATIPASAQISGPLTCVANAGVPPIVRAEGFTELTGDVVITCTGGNPALPFLANFQIFLNTNITSRLTGGLSEALLMIDEPGVARATGPPTPFCVSPNPASNPNPAGCNPATAGATFQTGTYNVFRAAKAAQGENALVWAGLPITAPGTTGARTFRITNVRANAQGIGASSTLIPNQITMFISVSASQSLALNNPQQTVAFVQSGLQFDVRACNGAAIGSAANFAQCVSQNSALFGDPSRSAASGAQFGVRFTEGFQTAFKPRIDTAQGLSLPGQVFNTESGFVRTDLPDLTGVGIADHGTRLAARFNNVPAGVRLFVSTGAVTNTPDTTTAGTSAVLITTDLSGAGGGLAAPVSATTNLSCATVTTGTNTWPAAEVIVTAGTGLAVWEVTGSNPSQLDAAFFLVAVAYTQNTANNLPGLGQSTVTGNFAPFYATSNTAAAQMGTMPVPRFVDNPVSRNAFRIDQCVTNLLFPFVTNQAGFDTGIAISNTSRDPFANQSGRLQAGRCTLNYYGTTTGGGAAPAAQTTNANVEAGSQLLAVVSTGGNLGIAGTPGFQGYIIAQCMFQYAHGFAFVTDGPIGQARVAEGYLALVMDSPISSRGSQSEVLSH